MQTAINHTSSQTSISISGPNGASDSLQLMPNARVVIPRFWSATGDIPFGVTVVSSSEAAVAAAAPEVTSPKKSGKTDSKD